MGPMTAILKLRHQMQSSISSQQEMLSTAQQVLLPTDDVVTSITDENLEEVPIEDVTAAYTASDAITNSEYTIEKQANSTLMTVTRRINDDSEDETVTVDLSNSNDEVKRQLEDAGISAENMISGINVGKQLNETIEAMNEQFLTQEKIDLGLIHSQLTEAQLLVTEDQRELYVQCCRLAENGKLHKQSWLKYASNILGQGKKASDDERFHLDDSDPFPKATFMNTVWKVVMGAISLMFAALGAIFGALFYVISAVFSLIGSLISDYQEYTTTVDIDEECTNGRINGPIICQGWAEDDPRGIVLHHDSYIHRYEIPGFEYITYSPLISNENPTAQNFINGYINVNVDPVKLRNYLYRNLKVRVTMENNQSIPHIECVKTLFDQNDPEWRGTFSENQQDVYLSMDDWNVYSGNQDTIKLLIATAIFAFYCNFIHVRELDNFFDKVITKNGVIAGEHVLIIDDRDNIKKVTTDSGLEGLYNFAGFDEFYADDANLHLAYFNQNQSDVWHNLAYSALNNLIYLLAVWKISAHGGASIDDFYKWSNLTNTQGPFTIIRALCNNYPQSASNTIQPLRNQLLTAYGPGVHLSSQFSNVIPFSNMSAEIPYGFDSFQMHGRDFFLDLELTPSTPAPTYPYRIPDYLTYDWNVLDFQITGAQFYLPDPGVQSLIRAVAIIGAVITVALVATKVVRTKFAKWTRMKQMQEAKALEAKKKRALDMRLSQENHKLAVKDYNKAIFKYNIKAKIFGWGSYDASNSWFNTPENGSITASIASNDSKINELLNTSTASGDEITVTTIAEAINPRLVHPVIDPESIV